MVDKVSFGNKLKEVMSSYRVRPTEMARALNRTRHAVYKWTQGVNTMSKEDITTFCDVFRLADTDRRELYLLAGYYVAEPTSDVSSGVPPFDQPEPHLGPNQHNSCEYIGSADSARSVGSDLWPPLEPASPPELPGFLARSEELAILMHRLKLTHLVVIAGPPGIGKTTLAAMLAQQCSMPTNTFWHSFHLGETIETMIWMLAGFLARTGQSTVWTMLQRPYQSGRQQPPTDVLCDYLFQALCGRDILLCLDDFHIVEQDPFFDLFLHRLLAKVRMGLIALVLTSRQIPNFVPTADVISLGGLNRQDAAGLLTNRGHMLPHELITDLFTCTEGNAQLLILSSAMLQVADDPAIVITRLTETDDVGQYVLNEVDHHLTSDERTVMGAVAVLLDQGGTYDAIESLLDLAGLRRILHDLSRRYLLTVSQSPGGKVYGQHTIVQTFYYGQLSLRERRTLHQRAGSYYETIVGEALKAVRHFERSGDYKQAASLATADVPALINRGQAQDLAQLLDLFRADQFDPVQWAAICTARGEVAALHGQYALARSLFDQALQSGSALDFHPALVEAQARRYRLLALISERIGAYAQAEMDCRDGLRLMAEVARPNVEKARLYIQLAEVLVREGDLSAVEQACHEGLAALPPGPAGLRERAALLQRLATVAGERGQYGEAIASLEHALVLSRQASDPALVAPVLHNLGRYNRILGRHRRALECYEESLQIKEQIGDVAGQVTTINSLGLLHMASSDPGAALQCFTRCRDLSKQLNMPDVFALSLINMSHIQFEQGSLDEAWANLLQAHDIYTELGSVNRLAGCLYRLADIALARADAGAAREYGGQALALARQTHSVVYEACALRVLGEVLLAQSQIAEAAVYLVQAWETQAQADDPYDQACIRAAQARLFLAQEDPIQARTHAQASLELLHGLWAPRLIAAMEHVISCT